MLRKFKDWVIKKTFEKYYGNFIYPFDKADDIRAKLPQPAQHRYLLDVNSWTDSKAYKTEIEEITRKFYPRKTLPALPDYGSYAKSSQRQTAYPPMPCLPTNNWQRWSQRKLTHCPVCRPSAA